MSFWHEKRGGEETTLYIRRLVNFRGRRIDLHKMVNADDEGCYHSHPALAWRFVLWGGYIEETPDEEWIVWKPWRMGFVRPEFKHRIAFLLGKCSISLWIRGKVTHKIDFDGC